MGNSISTAGEILTVFRNLPVKEKIKLSKAIDREILIVRAKALDKSVKKNNVSMSDIVNETKAARYERKHIRS
jgi:hypothetical protein